MAMIRYKINKHWRPFNGPLELSAQMRTSDSYMGRFGAGWQWNIGVEASSLRNWQTWTILVHLLVGTLRISFMTRKEKARHKALYESFRRVIDARAMEREAKKGVDNA